MSHYIRTIHTDFTASTSTPTSSRSSWATFPYAGTSASAHANLVLNLDGIMNKYPPGLGHSAWRGPSSGSTGASPYTRRRTAISVRAPHSSPARRAPPPPPHMYPRAQPASTTYMHMNTSMSFDPFSDDCSIDLLPPRRSLPPPSDPVLYRTPPYTIQIPPAEVAPPPPPQFDRNARSRLVAGILLNRVHAVGKPMRRRSMDGPKEYVKSGLSRVVCVEA